MNNTDSSTYWKALFQTQDGKTAIDIRDYPNLEEAQRQFEAEKEFFGHAALISMEQVDRVVAEDFMARRLYYSHAHNLGQEDVRYYTLDELKYGQPLPHRFCDAIEFFRHSEAF